MQTTLLCLSILMALHAGWPVHGGTTEESPQKATADWRTPAGNILWLDPSTLQRSGSASSPVAEFSIDRWTDRSGSGRNFEQRTRKSQPRLRQVDGASMVYFDGESCHLRSSETKGELTSATIFLVAVPEENLGDFRGLLSANAKGVRDYESGFNVDLGPLPSRDFESLNVEGIGFSGAKSLCNSITPFGTLKYLRLTIDGEKREIEFWLDQKKEGVRPWEPTKISIEQMTLGSRFYTNGPGEQQARGFFKGDIGDVLVFDRVLSAEEVESVESYLKGKYDSVRESLAKKIPGSAKSKKGILAPLTLASNPPAIQLLQPGFEVKELPVQLTNINNVLYRQDGRLVTLAYNGDIHLLEDTDGDGIEDQAKVFWKNQGSLRGPIGMAIPPKGYPKGNGIFVASKGKISWIVDQDGDDLADEEVVVASGWKEIPQNVDAVGLAMAADGSLYFGLGTANYANAYLVDDQGKAGYDLSSERGTVQRISSDWKTRETVCTGIRFPIAFAFHSSGDLFCTEQEGATWLANGNPFDELLYIEKGKHYGFPPRHPTYNPSVIDEPSVFDYGPQHQSTCGMFFNAPNSGGKFFGPASWRADAIVCGESRGKLWRTKLIKSQAGYIASTQLFACLQELTVDACLSPRGDMIVACHSGPPDWGTGPTGIGHLYRIKMRNEEVARPVAVWAESPNEIRIAFDRAVDPKSFLQLSERARVEYGDYVRAGDRFESLVPPYAVVKRQSLAPRYSLPVISASITPDLRTILLGTQSISSNTSYAVSLPYQNEGTSDLHAIDVDFTLSGVRASWQPKAPAIPARPEASGLSDTGGWNGWLPHLDLQAARLILSGSAMHEGLWSSLDREGILSLHTRIDLKDLLRPKVQVGATIDYVWPEERPRLRFTCSHPFQLNIPSKAEGPKTRHQSTRLGSEFVLEFEPTGLNEEKCLDVEIQVEVKGGSPRFECSSKTNEDANWRALPLNRFRLPWSPTKQEEIEELAPTKIAEIEGGNWGKGRRLFHSEVAGCFKCHSLQDRGAKIGPDLSNLIHRDYASVLRDIVHPSFSINPDYIGHVVALEDGQVLTGVLRTMDGGLFLGDEKGTVTRLAKDQIQSMKPSQASVMPKGLEAKLSPEQLRDLMTFLLTPPPRMPEDVPLPAPPIRSQQELAQVLAGSEELPKTWKPLKIVLVSGKKDHGKGEHDYPAWQMAWAQLMAAAPEVDVSLAFDFPSQEQLASADVLIFFQKGAWNDDRAKSLDPYLARGGGAVYIHWAVNGDERVADFSNRIGLASRGGNIRYRHGPLSLNIHSTDHPIVRNFDKIELYDESYWLLTGERKDIQLLATSLEEGEPQPQMWTYKKGEGRVFVSIPGHYSWTFDDPLFRVLLLRGIAWVSKEPVDRFNELVPLGARLSK